MYTKYLVNWKSEGQKKNSNPQQISFVIFFLNSYENL